jgi:hypothetical protein
MLVTVMKRLVRLLCLCNIQASKFSSPLTLMIYGKAACFGSFLLLQFRVPHLTQCTSKLLILKCHFRAVSFQLIEFCRFLWVGSETEEFDLEGSDLDDWAADAKASAVEALPQLSAQKHVVCVKQGEEEEWFWNYFTNG